MTTRIEESTSVSTDHATETVDPRHERRSRAALSWLLRAGSLVGAVLSWHLLTTYDVQAWLRFDELPAPVEVYQALVRELGASVYYVDVLQSLVRILSGFAIAAVAGIALGTLIARVRVLGDVLQPLFEVSRSPTPTSARTAR
ncbi:ABC transporter permease [Saccharopolyspora flava]|uniref:NitT/TauT family transport system permease protein n=1 Tax=Saccharopolyspora flava TaxID=95161 RepID=A0A1I6UTM2_9PSEU|nr:hypothetical protein [Saccharopolyspora flava]SFT04674.1 NitT/TauT family transport system permease protein [Saccharopolyspora flava]